MFICFCFLHIIFSNQNIMTSCQSGSHCKSVLLYLNSRWIELEWIYSKKKMLFVSHWVSIWCHHQRMGLHTKEKKTAHSSWCDLCKDKLYTVWKVHYKPRTAKRRWLSELQKSPARGIPLSACFRREIPNFSHKRSFCSYSSPAHFLHFGVYQLKLLRHCCCFSHFTHMFTPVYSH